jgi:intein/homing endonuclease
MKKWTNEELEFLLSNYAKSGIKYCAENLNKSCNSIQKKASNLGLKVDNEIATYLRSNWVKESWKKRSDSKKNLDRILNVSIDDIYNNSTFLYILGYIWGDGHIHNVGISKTNSLSLEVTKEDGLDMYDKMLSVINWNVYYRKRSNRKEQICFTICNRVLIEYLVSLDFHKKSYKYPVILDKLSSEMRRYFYLGLSDADGCFYYNQDKSCYQYSISSTSEQDWKHVSDIFEYLDIKFKIKKREQVNKSGNIHRHSLVLISNKKDILKFGDYLYSDNFIGIERKYKKYLEIKNL